MLLVHKYKLFLFKLSIILLMIFILSCSGNKNKEISYEERTLQVIYKSALKKLNSENYEEAIFEFDEVERQHPYSSWARRSMLMSAYTYYLQNKYDEAISSAQRFISLHPGNRHAVYAYYLIGQSYYERISDVARDQKITDLALNSFTEVVRRYPESDYARDAQLKIDLTRDHLAGKEMYIGRYYMKQSAFLAAINRFRYVVTEYQNTSHTPEALHRIVEGYISLGLINEAKATAAVLGYNFPDSEWYESTYDLINDFLQ